MTAKIGNESFILVSLVAGKLRIVSGRACASNLELATTIVLICFALINVMLPILWSVSSSASRRLYGLTAAQASLKNCGITGIRNGKLASPLNRCAGESH